MNWKKTIKYTYPCSVIKFFAYIFFQILNLVNYFLDFLIFCKNNEGLCCLFPKRRFLQFDDNRQNVGYNLGKGVPNCTLHFRLRGSKALFSVMTHFTTDRTGGSSILLNIYWNPVLFFATRLSVLQISKYQMKCLSKDKLNYVSNCQ